MKLIGSMVEERYRTQLKSSWQLIFSETRGLVLKVLQSLCPDLNTAYILHWIPEQGEDFWHILIDDKFVAKICLQQDDDSYEAELVTVAQYRQTKTKSGRIKLLVALDLVKQDSISNK